MAEHVSFFTAKVKPGKRGVVLRHFRKWDREQRRYAKGFLRSTVAVGREVPNEIRGVVYWDNSRNYYTNARRPAQGQWHQELVALLNGSPRWWDGTLGVQTGRSRGSAMRMADTPV